MKSLLITDSYLPHVGGSRIYYHHLYSNMPENCAVVLTSRTRSWREYDKKQPFPIYRIGTDLIPLPIPFISSIIRHVFLFIMALYIVIRHRIRVVHCGEPEPAGVIGYLLYKCFGIPYMMYVHDDPEIPGLRWYPKIMRHCYRKASGIIAACSEAKNNVLRYGIDEKRIQVIRTALDSPFLRIADASAVSGRHGLEGKKVLLTVGRLVEEKGHDEVIKLLPLIIDRVPNTVYLIVGKGPYDTHLRRLAREHGVTDSIIFTGFVPQHELPSYFAACDLFVMLNKQKGGVSREGLGMVFLEASAQGKPVVGSTGGGTADAIVEGNTGYRIDIDQTQSMIDRITELLTNEDKRRVIGMNGRDFVLKNYANWKSRSESLHNFTKATLVKKQNADKGLSFEEENPHPVYN